MRFYTFINLFHLFQKNLFKDIKLCEYNIDCPLP